ncbi:MAG: SET domain-containing protein [Desulfobulbaceae bacterium]|nr:SET domain-containing protein [Desulfobulbaceae bacterium]
MIHPDTEVRFISDEKGRGLVATAFIPKGAITWILDPLDREIRPAELAAYDGKYREILLTYSFRNSAGNYIFCWDNGRHINHSCDNNCCLTPYQLELAVRDILPGEELTDDYGYLNIIAPFTPAPEAAGRAVIYPDDLRRYWQKWDRQLAGAWPLVERAAQPLRPFISDETWRILMAISHGQKAADSILNCFYPGE